MKKPATFKVPAHANKPVHRAIMLKLKKMTPAERRQTLVKAGVLTKSGKLAKQYSQPGPKRRRSSSTSTRPA